jgi:hypothetical protein
MLYIFYIGGIYNINVIYTIVVLHYDQPITNDKIL